jgi:hypothetical protein
MAKSFESLDETFDITPSEPVPKPMKRVKPIIEIDKDADREKDYTYARSQLYNIVEKMSEAVSESMEVAMEQQHPRSFEVAFAGAKHAADIVDKLADLHKKMNDLEKDDPKPQATQNVQNNMFVGSTAELMKMLKENK